MFVLLIIVTHTCHLSLYYTRMSSIEDLATHILHTSRFWKTALANNRTLTIISYQHDMYGKETLVNLCDILDPPPGLYCLSVAREDIVNNKTCSK